MRCVRQHKEQEGNLPTVVSAQATYNTYIEYDLDPHHTLSIIIHVEYRL